MDTFEKDFYDRAVSQFGLDYNFYGDWQLKFAKMAMHITDLIQIVSNHRDSTILDVGAACGVTLRGFRELNLFGKYYGVDISDYMTSLGRETHGFSEKELFKLDITQNPLPFDDESITLLNCTHVLEHLSEKDIPDVISEFARVLKPEIGIALIIIPTVKPGVSREDLTADNTHLIIRSAAWWFSRFKKVFIHDSNVRDRFKSCKYSPDNSPDSFYSHYPDWTVYGLRKK